MLVAADVGMHRQPLARDLGIEGDVVAIAARIAQEIPRAVEERVRDVGFAPRRAAALRTGRFVPLAHARQRTDPRIVGFEILDARQDDRQIGFGHRHRAALFAVDDRDRRTPITLPRNAPVVQPIVDLRFGRRRVCANQSTMARLPSATLMPVEAPGVHQRRRRRHTPAAAASSAVSPAPAITRTIGNPKALRELEVALVVARHRHDRAGAVVHQHVVRDPDRNARAVHGIDAVAAGEYAGLFLVDLLSIDDVALRRLRRGNAIDLDALRRRW